MDWAWTRRGMSGQPPFPGRQALTRSVLMDSQSGEHSGEPSGKAAGGIPPDIGG